MYVDNLNVSACEYHLYLGSFFAADGLVNTAIKIHAQSEMCYTLKLASFVSKNNEAPFLRQMHKNISSPFEINHF